MTDKDYGKQQFHKLAKSVGSGTDEHGAYQLIPISMVRGGKMKPFKVYTKPIKHIMKDTTPVPRGWYKNKHEPPRVRPRPCYTEALLTTPYGGFCPINCGHCYVNNGTRGYRSTGIPVAHYKYPEAMKKWVAKLSVCAAAYITSFTEPFHPLESTYHISQNLAQVFVDEGLPVFFLSRQLIPDWALDVLLENPYSYMQWSINTGNPDHYRRFSPGSFTLDEVYDDIQLVHDHDIFISIQCNPIIAGISSLDDICQLVYDVADRGANHLLFKFVEQVANNRKIIVERMHQRGLPNVDEFDNLFSQVIGGVYTIQQEVREEWLDVLLEETRKAGVTMSTCYEYYDNGFAGENLAPYYTTSDQCHGRGVPMFYRPEPGLPFKPIPGCYRKGCLYCLEHGTHACGNDKLLEATALNYSDLRSIKVDGDEKYWALEESCYTPDEILALGSSHMHSNPEMLTDAELWEWEE